MAVKTTTDQTFEQDTQQATPQQFRIMSIPTLMIKKDGKVVDQLIGYHSADQLKQVLNQYL